MQSQSITPQELSSAMSSGEKLELLDVRSPAEYAAVHVPGARLLPLDELECDAYVRQFAASGKTVYVLCHSGGRAQSAVEKFRRAGFGNCSVVLGGTQAWIDAGLPVVRGETKVLPLMQQVQIVVGAVSAAGAVLSLTFSPWFALVPLLLGCGLIFAGVTGFCGLAFVLARMPWNKSGTAGKTSCCSA